MSDKVLNTHPISVSKFGSNQLTGFDIEGNLVIDSFMTEVPIIWKLVSGVLFDAAVSL